MGLGYIFGWKDNKWAAKHIERSPRHRAGKNFHKFLPTMFSPSPTSAKVASAKQFHTSQWRTSRWGGSNFSPLVNPRLISYCSNYLSFMLLQKNSCDTQHTKNIHNMKCLRCFIVSNIGMQWKKIIENIVPSLCKYSISNNFIKLQGKTWHSIEEMLQPPEFCMHRYYRGFGNKQTNHRCHINFF